MPEATATEVRLPNPRYAASDFEPDWVRTIVLSEQEGISALIGKLKNGGMTAVMTYVFQKDKGWTPGTCQKWVDDHSVKAEVEHEVSDGDLVFAVVISSDVVDRYGRPEKVYRDYHGRFTSPTRPPTTPPGTGGATPIGWFGKLLADQKAKEDAAKQAAADSRAAAKKAQAQAEAVAKKAQRDAERAAEKAKADAEKAARAAEAARVKAEKEQTAAAAKAAKDAAALAEKQKAAAEKAQKDADRATAKSKADADKAAAKAKAEHDRIDKEAARQALIAQREKERLARQAEKEHAAASAAYAKDIDRRINSITTDLSTTGKSVDKVRKIQDQAANLRDDITAKTAALGAAKTAADGVTREINGLKSQLAEIGSSPGAGAQAEKDRLTKLLDGASGRLDAALGKVGLLEVGLRKADRELQSLEALARKDTGMIDDSIGNLKTMLGDLRDRAAGGGGAEATGKVDALTAKVDQLEKQWKTTPKERSAILASLTLAAEEAEDLMLEVLGEISRVADQFYGIELNPVDEDIVASIQVGGYLANGAVEAALDAGSPWEFSKQDADALLGADGNDWKQFARAHLLVDVRDGGDALPADKNRYLFPVAKMVDGKFTYFASGVNAAMDVLNGAHGVAGSVAWWSPAIRQTVYKTMQALYQQAGKAAPDLIMSHADSGYGFEMKLAADSHGPGDSGDGLVWKPVLREGHWAGVDQKTPIDITPQMMDDVISAFNAGVIEHVDVPLGHEAGVDQNTGFVRALKKQGNELWAGIQFTEPAVAEKVQRGTIANVSAWLKGSFTDWRDGKKWPWVLWHVALTNKPMITELAPFGELSAQMSVHRYSLEQERREGTSMPDDIKLSKEEYDKLLSLQGKLDAAHDRMSSMEQAIHQDNVKQIIASLQGRGTHDAVKLPASMGFPAAVVIAVQPLLESDLGQPKDVKLSADGKEQTMSVTDVVLSLLNAVAAATPGALISTAPVGAAVLSSPIGEAEETEEQRNKRVDGYLAARGLGPKKSD